MSLIELKDYSVELMTAVGVLRAVDRVDLRLEHGQTVTIIGESGSGKSTTAMSLLGLLDEGLAVNSGTASLLGVDAVEDQRGIAALRGRRVSLIPQDPMSALSPVHTVGAQLRQAVRRGSPGTSRAKAADIAVELLESVRIPEPATQVRKYPHQFSGGMLQRILIAIALAAQPEVLVADEPTSALDVTVQASVLDLLLELQENTGVAILMITHDLGVARLMSDTIHVMRRGRFVESGPAEQIVHHPQEEYTRTLLAAVPRVGGELVAVGTEETQ
ncbi:MAG: ABC transporter ATP-binding protein [Arthrobacter sp.]|jgi:peptide/nickel transport system ATP-binding protein|nr:ABC transporter ATP-binding protein [Arthrobacter sp.]